MPRRSDSALADRSAMAVRTQPGSTAFEVTPNGPASWATARASPISPCLEAEYALPERSAGEHEALVWFRKSERPVALVDIARAKADSEPIKAQRREKSPEVGQVLRRA